MDINLDENAVASNIESEEDTIKKENAVETNAEIQTTDENVSEAVNENVTTIAQEVFSYLDSRIRIKSDINNMLVELVTAAKKDYANERYGELLNISDKCAELIELRYKYIGNFAIAKLLGEEEALYVIEFICYNLINVFHSWNIDSEITKTADPVSVINILSDIIINIYAVYININSEDTNNISMADIIENGKKIKYIHESVNLFYKIVGVQDDPYLGIGLCHSITCNKNYAALLEASL